MPLSCLCTSSPRTCSLRQRRAVHKYHQCYHVVLRCKSVNEHNWQQWRHFLHRRHQHNRIAQMRHTGKKQQLTIAFVCGCIKVFNIISGNNHVTERRLTVQEQHHVAHWHQNCWIKVISVIVRAGVKRVINQISIDCLLAQRVSCRHHWLPRSTAGVMSSPWLRVVTAGWIKTSPALPCDVKLLTIKTIVIMQGGFKLFMNVTSRLSCITCNTGKLLKNFFLNVINTIVWRTWGLDQSCLLTVLFLNVIVYHTPTFEYYSRKQCKVERKYDA